MVRPFNPGGLFSEGVDPIRLQAMLRQQRDKIRPQAQAPRMLSAPTQVIREKNPLNTIGPGLQGLGKGLGAAFEKAGRKRITAPVSVTSNIPIGPGITPAPGPAPVVSQSLGTLEGRATPIERDLRMTQDQHNQMLKDAAAMGVPTTIPGAPATPRGPMQSTGQQSGPPSPASTFFQNAPPRQTQTTDRPATPKEMYQRALKEGEFELAAMFQRQVNTEQDADYRERRFGLEQKKMAASVRDALKKDQLLPGTKDYFKGASDTQKLFRSKQVVKDFYAVQGKAEEIKSLASNDDAMSDLGLVFAIAKIYDPTSVVRESEGKAIGGTAGWPTAIARAYEKAMGTAGLDAKTKENIVKIAMQKLGQVDKRYGAAVKQHYKTYSAGGRGYLAGDIGIPEADLNRFIRGIK